MNYEQALEYVHSLEQFGMKLGLERMEKLMSLLGNPQNGLRFIHVAGTNGKGSTCAMLERVLRHAGYHTGLYLSPFVLEYRERMQQNGQMITPGEFAECAGIVREKADRLCAEGDTLTEFEITTAIAFLWFWRQKCDVVCLEVGLGGRFGATNIIKNPLLCIIANIGLDHTGVLGDTLEKIAFEKSGIIKKGVPVITYSGQHIDALAEIMTQAEQKNACLILPNANAAQIKDCQPLETCFSYAGKNYVLSLHGRHQVYNAMMVVEAVNQLRAKGFIIDDASLRNGLRDTAFPARQEVLGHSPLMLLDGAHNLQGMQSLCTTVTHLKGKKVVVVGMLADKDYIHSLGEIAALCDMLITVTPQNPRALHAKELAHCAAQFTNEVKAYEDKAEALHEAICQAGPDGNVIVCGSLYLAAQMRPLMLKAAKQ